jgi:putative serine/threonine protein kinase
LPQDKGIEDVALYGGKRGWEVLERFFGGVGDYLMGKGQVLVLFSSLTNKQKVEEIIGQNMLEFEELERKRLPMFEELYVYLVWKSEVLRKLESRGVSEIKYFAHGKRGNVFVGVFDKSKLIKTHFAKPERVKVAIKVKRKESLAVERMKNEVRWLRVLNRSGIGPKLLFYGENFLVYEFVEGEFILEWIDKNKENKKILIKVMEQCFEMDKLGVNKEEMHRPLKHIIIDKMDKPVLIDFERCYEAKKPHNVTQFGQFLVNHGFAGKDIIEKLKAYKEEMGEDNFKEILDLI